MTIDPTRYSGPPTEPRSEQENAIYARLTELGIPFYRVDHEHADTMEDCLAIEKVLGGKICKNLFLCNRQGTRFYLLMMPGDKPFKTKYLSAQLGCARLSFADAGHMAEYLRTGLVARFPTLIVCGFVLMAAIQSFFAGMILSNMARNDRRDFETRRNLLHILSRISREQ